jgi:hypothetical protein
MNFNFFSFTIVFLCFFSVSAYGKNQVYVLDDHIYKHGIVADDRVWIISEPTIHHLTKPRSFSYRSIKGYTYDSTKVDFTFLIIENRFKSNKVTADDFLNVYSQANKLAFNTVSIETVGDTKKGDYIIKGTYLDNDDEGYFGLYLTHDRGNYVAMMLVKVHDKNLGVEEADSLIQSAFALVNPLNKP